MENEPEKAPERILTIREVMGMMESYVDSPKVARELYDEQGGLYLLEVKEEGEKPGEIIEYTYQRKGKFGRNTTPQTHIYVTHYEDDVPVTGWNVANYDEATGEWEELK